MQQTTVCRPRRKFESETSLSRCSTYAVTNTHEGSTDLLLKKVPEEVIRAALSETKYQDRMGRITKSRGAFFTHQLRRVAKERRIELD
jgi:hypothetical protein